jgi:hypothetical protein
MNSDGEINSSDFQINNVNYSEAYEVFSARFELESVEA